MKIRILGSGGFLPTPLPLCNCSLCNENHQERTGPSIYIDNLHLLIDTPEGIYAKIRKETLPISHVLYSHWHPDHTVGYRLFEYLSYSLHFIKPNVYLNHLLYDTFKKRVPALNYYEDKKFLNIKTVKDEKIKLKDTTIYFLKMNNDFSIAYLFELPQENILICMDHCKDLILSNIKVKIDLLIMNLGHISKTNDNKMHHVVEKSDETDFYQDNLRIIKELKPTKTVLTHIEPLWNLSVEDFNDIEKEFSKYNITFAVDNLNLMSR